MLHPAIPLANKKDLCTDLASQAFRWQNLLLSLFLFDFLLNFRSWPLAWHFRIFKPTFSLLPLSFVASLCKTKDKMGMMAKVLPIGANPFNYQVTYTSRAHFDDCDFHFHMSNSAYSKALDAAIMKMILHSFPVFFELGAWMPLAGVNFQFRKQIRLLVQYDVRVRIASWDDKWIYFVSEFVTKGKEEVIPVHDRLLYSFKNEDSNSEGSLPSSRRSPSSKSKVSANAIAVSKLCFKYGRITIPPTIVLATSGFCAPKGGAYAATSYSKPSPPPHMKDVRSFALSVDMDYEKLRAFGTHGWKDVPPEDRWWDNAFVGLEDRRKEGLKYVNQLIDAMEGLENLCTPTYQDIKHH